MIKTVLLFIIGLVLICAGGDRLVEAAVAIARKLKISEIVVGATIVSLGTTLPEILVSTTAAFDGSSAVAAKASNVLPVMRLTASVRAYMRAIVFFRFISVSSLCFITKFIFCFY